MSRTIRADGLRCAAVALCVGRRNMRGIPALFFIAIVVVLTSCQTWSTYIPADLDDAHLQLATLLPANELERIRQMPSETDMSVYHFGIGMWMRNNWGLWQGGRLASYFNGLGVHHADDMSAIIFDTFWCKLHGQPYHLKERVAYYEKYWLLTPWPTNAVSPTDGCRITFTRGSINTASWTNIQDMTAVTYGKTTNDPIWWAYEYEKGVYRPDAQILKSLNETSENSTTKSSGNLRTEAPNHGHEGTSDPGRQTE